MSLNGRPISMRSVCSALKMRGLEPEPSGTGEYHYVCDGQDYYLFCSNLPDFSIRRIVPLEDLLIYDDHALMSAVNTVNNRNHPVKVSFAGEERPELLFQLCSRERLYLDFLRDIENLSRKLDDVITSFRIACELCSDDEDRVRLTQVENMWESVDNPFKKALQL